MKVYTNLSSQFAKAVSPDVVSAACDYDMEGEFNHGRFGMFSEDGELAVAAAALKVFSIHGSNVEGMDSYQLYLQVRLLVEDEFEEVKDVEVRNAVSNLFEEFGAVWTK